MHILHLFTHLLCVCTFYMCAVYGSRCIGGGVRGQLVGLGVKFRSSGLVANAFTTKPSHQPLTKMLLLGKIMEFLKPKS